MIIKSALRGSRAASRTAGQFFREARSSESQLPGTCAASLGPRRSLNSSTSTRAIAATSSAAKRTQDAPSSNPPLEFPCMDAREARRVAGSTGRRISASSGPEPSYTTGKHETWHSEEPLHLDEGGVLPSFDIAYETWGTPNADRSNVILLHTGLSASSHAHSTPDNPQPGWWEQYIGPGAPLDTDRYFVVCTNVLGGCYGSTGPASTDPASGEPYGTRFPIVTLHDMVRAQFRLLDALGITRLAASVGASMGGMQSLAAAVMHPERVGRVVSISGCARSHAYSVALRHLQRQALMMDPKWKRGFYYGPPGTPPVDGLKLARQIATVTYRSGPEWEHRFGRRRADPSRPPALCPDFLIETYLDHAGDKFDYDANSLLYVSKAMDMFDLSKSKQDATAKRRLENQARRAAGSESASAQDFGLTLPDTPYQEQEPIPEAVHDLSPAARDAILTGALPSPDLVDGLRSLRDHPMLVLGVASDILFPARQQREIAESLRATGNRNVTHVELGEDTSLYGHDTFLLSVKPVGDPLRRFLD